MSDVNQGGMNPALKIILGVFAGACFLVCMGGAVAVFFVSKGVQAIETEVLRAQTDAQIEMINAMLADHHSAEGIYPATLNDVGVDAGSQIDAWNRPFIYEASADGQSFELLSYGADGIEGGEGPDADLILTSGEPAVDAAEPTPVEQAPVESEPTETGPESTEDE